MLIVYLGARAVLDASLTVGMLTAFIAYKGQFTSRISALVENLIAWKLLDVNLERLADIALNPREPRIDEGIARDFATQLGFRPPMPQSLQERGAQGFGSFSQRGIGIIHHALLK